MMFVNKTNSNILFIISIIVINDSAVLRCVRM